MNYQVQVLYSRQLMIRLIKTIKMVRVLRKVLMIQGIHHYKFNENLLLFILFDNTRGTEGGFDKFLLLFLF